MLARKSRRSSGKSTIPMLGSIVQKGKFSALAGAEVRAEKIVDFPTLGSPTIPHSSAIYTPSCHPELVSGSYFSNIGGRSPALRASLLATLWCLALPTLRAQTPPATPAFNFSINNIVERKGFNNILIFLKT